MTATNEHISTVTGYERTGTFSLCKKVLRDEKESNMAKELAKRMFIQSNSCEFMLDVLHALGYEMQIFSSNATKAERKIWFDRFISEAGGNAAADHQKPIAPTHATESDELIPTRCADHKDFEGGSFVDLTGEKFGLFTVCGLALDAAPKWVVRCDCGTYSLRSGKAIRNPANHMDRCNKCRKLEHLK